MTATRNHNTAPVFRAFRDYSGLPPEERRQCIMERLEHIWKEAQEREYERKDGTMLPMPDGTLQLKVIQAVAVLEGMTGAAAEADEAAARRMSDADLLRAATKRLPPHEVAALADQLMLQREQQLTKTTIETTGENTDEQQVSSRKNRKQ